MATSSSSFFFKTQFSIFFLVKNINLQTTEHATASQKKLKPGYSDLK